MTKKTKTILAIVGALILIGVPILYKKYEIPQETTTTILAFAAGIVSTLSGQKVVRAHKEKKAKSELPS